MLLEQQASPRENHHWTGVVSPLLYPGYKEWDKGPVGHFWLDEVHILGGNGTVRQISSPYGVGGATGYTAQDDLNSVNSYNTGEGKMIRVRFFPSWIPRASLVLSALLSLGQHILQHHIQKHPFFDTWPLWSNSSIHTWLPEKS